MNLICIAWKYSKYQALKSFHVSPSGNGILPSQFPIPGSYLHSHISPAFFKQKSSINCPGTNLNNLNIRQHSMIQFPPHLLESTANFTITFPKSHIPNIQQASLSLNLWTHDQIFSYKSFCSFPAVKAKTMLPSSLQGWCSLLQPCFNSLWAAADWSSSLVWVQDMYTQLYPHTLGTRRQQVSLTIEIILPGIAINHQRKVK